MKRKKVKTSSIEKALRILMGFVPNNPDMGTVVLSRELGFHPATVNRILVELTRNRFLQQNPLTRKFTLGPSVAMLGLAITRSLKSNLVVIAKPFIDELRDSVKETVVLEVLSGKSTVVACVAEGPPPLPLAANIGDRLPMAAAGAKAILAFLPQGIIQGFLNEKIPRLTPKTVLNRKVLQHQLEEIRQKGYALDNEEIEIGINAVAAPIFNHEEKPVGAIVVAGSSRRVTANGNSTMVARVKEKAESISAQLFNLKSMAKQE